MRKSVALFSLLLIATMGCGDGEVTGTEQLEMKRTLSVSSGIAAGATLSGTVTWTATVSGTGADRMQRVDFYVDGVLRGSDATSPYAYALDTTALSNGPHALKLYATAAGVTASCDVQVSVSNTTATPPPPSPTPTPTGRLRGFSSHVPSDATAADAYVKRLASVGAKLMRDDLPWAWSESTKGVFNLGRADLICGLASKYGMKVVFQIGFAPSWANGGHQDKYGPTADHLADWANWAGTVAGYLHTHCAGLVEGIEYWNEPNISFLINPATNVQGDAAYYATLVNAAYPKMKAAAPEIPVWAGSTAGSGTRVWNGPMDWAEDVLKLIGHNFDAWSCHPYYFTTGITADAAVRLDLSTGFSRSFWNPSGLESLADVLARYGYNGPIHATEAGIPTDSYPAGVRIDDGGFGTTSEYEQGRWWPLVWKLWTSQARAGDFMVYTGQDTNSSDTTTREAHFGAFRSDGSQKPIAQAMIATP